MKKVLFIILTLITSISIVYAEEDITPQKRLVTLDKCDSGVSIWVVENNEYKIVRLIAYDETNEDVSNQVCSMIENASTIEIENDVEIYDKYNRELVWMYLDGKLLQSTLIEQGLGQVNFVTSDFNYINDLCMLQKNAIENKLGIWNSGTVKEEYCDSGVEVTEEENEETEELKEESKLDKKDLYHIVYLSSGILLLILIMLGVNKHGIK